MANMIVLTAEQAGKMIWKDQFSHAVLRPIRLSDNRYALPESALTQPEHARWRSILNAGSIEDSATLTYSTTSPTNYRPSVNGHQMYLRINTDDIDPASYGYPAPRLFDIPSPNLLRFECRHGNDLLTTDYGNNRRRVEISENDYETNYGSGDTLWDSWSTIITDQRAGFDMNATSIIHQWHHASNAGFSTMYSPPPFAVILNNGQLTIGTRYGNGGVSVGTTHYTGPAPDTGAITNFVVSALLGASGHINIWMNGEQIVDVDTPIGYYDESPPYLAYVQTGIYMDNTHTVDVIYHANLEFGLTDLSARIDNPLPIPAPPEGWGTSTPVIYPADDLYPINNLYPA